MILNKKENEQLVTVPTQQRIPFKRRKGAARDDAKILADPFHEKMVTVHDDADTSESKGNGGTW